VPLNTLRHHLDRSTRALCDTQGATLTIIILKLKAPTRAQFSDGVIWADAVATVALETAAAGHTALCLIQGIALIEATNHFSET